MGPHMEVSLHVDDRRNVVSITFAKPAPSGDPPRPPLQAVRMEQLSPNLVVKYNSAGNLVGIDLFEAASVLGLKDAEGGGGPSISFRVGHVPVPGPPPATPDMPARGEPAPRAEPSGSSEEAGAGAYGKPAMPRGGPDRGGPGGAPVLDGASISALPAVHRKEGIRSRATRRIRGRAPWISRLRALLTGRQACPHCGLLFHKKHLKFKRFLNRDEAEALERKTRLKSHFVYGCPRCRGDLLDM